VSVAISDYLFPRCAFAQQINREWLHVLIQEAIQESKHQFALKQLRRQSNQENMLKVDLALEVLNLSNYSLQVQGFTPEQPSVAAVHIEDQQ
jgi:hypothetical protein